MKSLGEVVQQRPGRAARSPSGQVPGIVLHAGAEPGLPHHLQVIVGAGLKAGGLQDLTLPPELSEPLFQLRLDVHHGHLKLLSRGHEVLGREDLHLLALGEESPR